VNLLAAGVAYYVLQWVIIRAQGTGSALRRAIGSDFKGKISPVLYIAGIVAGLASGAGSGWNRPGIWIAVACYVGAALLWVIPDRRIERKIEAIAAAEQASPDPDPDRQR
jgi:hypothetical protein